jgi:hypothetical protein
MNFMADGFEVYGNGSLSGSACDRSRDRLVCEDATLESAAGTWGQAVVDSRHIYAAVAETDTDVVLLDGLLKR